MFLVATMAGLLSDEADNGIWKGGKQMMYEGGIRVPTFAVWKNNIKANTQTTHQALTMDLFPTFCEAAGVVIPKNIDGNSMLTTLMDKPQPARDKETIWVRREGGITVGKNTTLFAGSWKILQNTPFEPFQLFDLSKDSLETTDIKKANPSVFEDLQKKMRKHIQKAGAVPWQQ
ncbi:MAG: sulfatase-like hydrolase/transferase [Spirosomataceae bacterium]